MKHDKQVTLAITGASGAPYALTLLKSLVNADYQVYVLISSAAKVVFATEENVKIPGRRVVFTGSFRLSGPRKNGGLPVFYRYAFGH